MKYLIEADIISFLKNLVAAFQPFAKAQEINLCFKSTIPLLLLRYHPEEITLALTSLLCRIITFTPQNESVILNAAYVEKPMFSSIQLEIINSGADLSRIGEITKLCKFPVLVSAVENGGTKFELHWEMESLPHQDKYPNAHIPPQIRGFYASIRNRLESHFTHLENKISAISVKNPHDAVFLQKVNAIVLANLDKEDFDTNHLGKSLAMSRTKLFRQLKSLLQESPAHYIRCFRLQKAKEMLEKTEFSVGEVAFKTGFQSQSHFTRVFTKQFGVQPSAFRRTNQVEGNK